MQEQVHEQASDLAAVVREGEDAQQVVVRARRDAQGVATALGLGVVDPVDDLPHLVGDLVGRRVLVEVEPVLGDVLAVLDRLDVALFRMEDEVDPLDHVERDGQALLGREVADELDGLLVAADLFAHRLQARVLNDRRARIDGRLRAPGRCRRRPRARCRGKSTTCRSSRCSAAEGLVLLRRAWLAPARPAPRA